MACGRTSARKRSPPPKRLAAIRSSCGNGTRGAARCIAACEPNPAHRVLADWSRRFPNFRLITQNVDGLHETCRHRQNHRSSPARVDLGGAAAGRAARRRRRRGATSTVSFDELPPRCPHCGGRDPAGRRLVRRNARSGRGRTGDRGPQIATCSSPSARPPWCIPPRGSSTRREAAWRVHRRDQPRGDAGLSTPSIWCCGGRPRRCCPS